MVGACKQQIITALAAAAVGKVFDKQEDASRHKGAQYALLQTDDEVGMSYDGAKIGKTDNLQTLKRTYHIRRYATTFDISVRIAAKDDATAFNLMSVFLGALSRQFDDGHGYAIEVVAGAARFINDKSIITIGVGYEVQLTFSGGIYITKTVPLIGTVEPEGEIVKEV